MRFIRGTSYESIDASAPRSSETALVAKPNDAPGPSSANELSDSEDGNFVPLARVVHTPLDLAISPTFGAIETWTVV